MTLPVPTTIASGFGDAGGCAYRLATDTLLVTDAGSGNIWSVNAHTHAKATVGGGYQSLHDIALSADDLHAYLAESPGTLLRAPLSNLNKAAATVVASGFNGIDQVALDEAHGFAYVTEFTASQIQRVNLTTGAKTVVASASAPRGVLVTADGRYLYVSSDAGTITRFDLATNTSAVVASGLNGPRHLLFADAGESTILFPVHNPSGTVHRLDLTASPPAESAIAGPTPPDPYSLAALSPNHLLITSAQAISEVDLTSSVFSSGGPTLLGIGFVPADVTHLPNGYADTTIDPGYFFQVKDCPFGGTLPLMINWQGAHTAGANFYQVSIAGPGGSPVTVTQAFSDYLWNAGTQRFDLVTTVADNGYYALRATGQIWLNNWLGLLLDTSAQPNGLNRISVRLFSAKSAASEIGHDTDPGRSASVVIDNTQPTAIIHGILQQPGSAAVGACAIVNSGTPTFTFDVTASAPAHLRAWTLTAYWGDNKSKAVASDDYSHHVSPSRLWAGLSHVAVPPPPPPAPWNATVTDDPTSTHCAHSFFLYAWDRVINGWGYIHGPAGYQQSITLLL